MILVCFNTSITCVLSPLGPLPKTFCDFWRMVWEQMVLIIVMTTR